MITRRAFSRTANLGQLYDAHNDMLLPSNILNLNEKDNIQTAIKNNKNEYVEHDFLYAYTNDDQFKHLEIDANLRLNLYAGLIDIGGSGKYLTSTKTNENSIKGSFYYKLVKEDDELFIENLWADAISKNEINKLFNIQVLFGEMSKNATHVVIKRQFGADLFFTFESKKGDKDLLRKIETRVEVAIVEAEAGVSTSKEQSSTTNYEDIHVSFYGDCKPPSKYKGTVESVLESLQDITEMTQEPKQMKWILYPIHHLVKLQQILNETLENDDNLWKKHGYVISPSKYILKDLNNDKYKLLFYSWDLLLKNKQKLDILDNQIQIDDSSYYRNIIKNIKTMQIHYNESYKNNVINKIIQIKETQKDLELTILDDLIIQIDTINSKIEKYLSTKINLNINKNGQPNVININRINNLRGLNYIRFINRQIIDPTEYEQMNELIYNTKNTYLQKNYYFFCNSKYNQEIIEKDKDSKNLIRYIRLYQNNINIPKDQRWLHINTIEIYDNNGIKIPLNTKYIKIKYSSKSQEWSKGDIITDSRSSYFHTNNDIYEWIYIDLGTEVSISKIILYNRHDVGNPHDNIIRLTGAILELYRDFSELKNKYIVHKFLITARAIKYEFDLIKKYKLDDSVNYLIVNKILAGSYLKPNSLFENEQIFIHNDIINFGYNFGYEASLINDEINTTIPAQDFKWTDSNHILINNYDITEYTKFLNYELDSSEFINSMRKIKLIDDINKELKDITIDKTYKSFYIKLPYYVPLKTNNNFFDNITYKFWNSKLLAENTNLIMWLPENEINNISVINDRYLIDLCMPCPHDLKLDCEMDKNWVCFQCFSIAKIRKIKNKWYFNCWECNKIILINNCFFMCNHNITHGPEPYPFNDLFDCERLKFNYLNGGFGLFNDASGFKISIDHKYIKYEYSDINKYKYCIPNYIIPTTNRRRILLNNKVDNSGNEYPYESFSPYTIFVPDHKFENEYITIDFKNECGHYFYIRQNYIYHQYLICSEYNNIINRCKDELNDIYNQFKNNSEWITDYNNIKIQFLNENRRCKINGNEYYYKNINPHTCTVRFKVNSIFKKTIYKWFFIMNTQLDKLFCVEFKNGKTNNWYTASLV